MRKQKFNKRTRSHKWSQTKPPNKGELNILQRKGSEDSWGTPHRSLEDRGNEGIARKSCRRGHTIVTRSST